MTSIKLNQSLKTGICALSLAITGLLATGCGNSETGSSPSGGSASSSAAAIEGNIQDIHGPIYEGKVEVLDKSGKSVVSFELGGSSNHYAIKVPAGTSYPILLVATPKPGGNSQVVKAVVTSSLADRMDITDITTLVVESASALGGLTEENIAKASGSAIGLRQRQGPSAGGGHGGHDMSNMGGGSSGTTPEGQNQQPMQH